MPYRGKKEKSSMSLFAQPKSGMPLGLKLSIISVLFALWWSVVFSSVFLVSRHFFLSVFSFCCCVPHVNSLLLFFHCLGHLLGWIHSVFLLSSSVFYLFPSVPSLFFVFSAFFHDSSLSSG
jgi:hypothetical protein